MFRRMVWAGLMLLLAACSRDHRTPLVIYSPHGRDLLTLFEHQFEAEHPALGNAIRQVVDALGKAGI